MDQPIESSNHIPGHVSNHIHLRMLSRLKLVFIVALILAGISSFLTYKYFHQTSDVESILGYDVTMDIQKNKEAFIVETIVYDFGRNRKRGIARYIPLTRTGGPRLGVSVSSVVDESGNPYKYEAKVVDDVLAVKTGDPADLIKGVHTYKIKYKVENVIRTYDNLNEISWNATGDQWPVEIKRATASVTLPSQIGIIKMDCSTGPRASTEKNCTYSSSKTGEATKVIYSTTKPLMVIEGFTILLDLPLGI